MAIDSQPSSLRKRYKFVGNAEVCKTAMRGESGFKGEKVGEETSNCIIATYYAAYARSAVPQDSPSKSGSLI